MDRNLKLLAIVLGLSVLTAALMAQVEPPQRTDNAVLEGPPPPPPGTLAEVKPESEAPPPPEPPTQSALPAFGQPMTSGEPLGQTAPVGSADPMAPGGGDTASGARPAPPDYGGIESGPPAFPGRPGDGADSASGPAPVPPNPGF